MPTDYVADDEVLFRNISIVHNQCKRDTSGHWRLSSQAFSDRYYKPSVDRAILCNADPSRTQKSPKDGVVSVLAVDVRKIKDLTQKDAKGNVITTHAFDVIPDAVLPHNPAHALIISTPACSNQRVFKKLLERLQYIANLRGWLIEPQE